MTTYTIKVDVNQARQVISDRLSVKVPAALGRSGEEAGQAVLDEASANAPVDTGELAGSGQMEKTTEGARVYFTAEHAPYVEFGTVYQSAQPFLGPALESQRSSVISKYKQNVKAAVET